MVCANCGAWAYRCSWISHRPAEADPRRRLAYVCSRDSELYWFAVCRPNCELNAVRHASFKLEVAAMASEEAGMSFAQLKPSLMQFVVYKQRGPGTSAHGH